MKSFLQQHGYNCQVVSAEMPSGAAILANVMVAWNVPVIDPWNLSTSGLYEQGPGGRIRVSPDPSGFETLMPELRRGQILAWRTDVIPRFHHCSPAQSPPRPRTIWIVRDPRDCLYSAWRREKTASFARFLSAEWRYPGESALTYITRFCTAWLSALPALDGLLVRFEDLKRSPGKSLLRVSEYLGLGDVLASSTHPRKLVDWNRARKAESRLPERLRAPFTVNRAGQPEEWRESWDSETTRVLNDEFFSLLERLGYDQGG
ncbi:sulfotransferase [Marinihelvus fidelis]|uniref:Sulfotransferase n=1 Tax=Marinihelvus fidelis TaxID=2613842 RepID=A0A5N0TDX2_9GAMM|nr:sulfotransferase domain-containing protein [Marinihelvus fidelis]KAA9133215.1 sulfotransferase [Marinihelvus fidelis]